MARKEDMNMAGLKMADANKPARGTPRGTPLGSGSRLAAALAVALVAGIATAQPAAAESLLGGWYGALHGGINKVRSSDIKGPAKSVQPEYGWLSTAAIGYGFANNVRVEGEFTYRANGIKSERGASGTGDITSQAFMGNVFYDVNLGWKLYPYAGLGFGVERLNYNNVRFTDGLRIDDSDWQPVFQVTGGIGYKVTPKISLNIEGRFHRDFRYLRPPNFSMRTDSQIDANVEYRNISALAGIRYKF